MTRSQLTSSQSERSRARASGIRWLALGAGVFAVQLAVVYGLAATPKGREWLPLSLPLAHLLLLPFLLANIRMWGMRLILVGLALNLAAMLANGGLMPVEANAVEAVGRHEVRDLHPGSHIAGSKNVLLPSDEIRLKGLTDILVIPLPKPFTRAVSVGDLFVLAGLTVAGAEVAGRAAGRQVEVTR